MRPGTDELRQVEVLSDLSADELGWLADHTEVHNYDGGQTVVHAGDPADHLFLMLDGQIDYFSEQGGNQLRYVTRQGEVAGMLPKSRMTHFASTGTAVGSVRIAKLHRSLFPELAAQVPSLDARLLAVMTRRIRDAAHAEEQRERMSALGKLSAGLAHELNNPAAAVRRDAADLTARLDTLPELVSLLVTSRIPGLLLEQAEDTIRARQRGALGPLQQADAEDDLLEMLETVRQPRAAELAATLVEAGLHPEDLGWIKDNPDHSSAILTYLEFRLGSLAALQNIGGATARISDLVSSIKRYSHMDRGGDRQATDVRIGLDSTLTMLGHRLRDRKIQVLRDYQDPLPAVLASEGELNQVWTNLIDNAADAMNAGGKLTLAAALDGSRVRVSVSDTGPGIPPEVLNRIFEPFFTTKGVGEGTGLGLDLVQRVVVRQHGGEIRVRSEPGHTEFQLYLPSLPG